MSHKRNGDYKTQKDDWETPKWLFNLLNQEFRFDLDGACTRENCLCDHGCFEDEGMIAVHWYPTFERIFINPPYSAGNINKFMQKAYEESQKGAVVVCLVPVASDVGWWHNYVMKAQEIRFIKGRVKFVGYDAEGKQIKNSPTFSSCVVIFKPPRKEANVMCELCRLGDGPIIGRTIEQPRKVKA